MTAIVKSGYTSLAIRLRHFKKHLLKHLEFNVGSTWRRYNLPSIEMNETFRSGEVNSRWMFDGKGFNPWIWIRLAGMMGPKKNFRQRLNPNLDPGVGSHRVTEARNRSWSGTGRMESRACCGMSLSLLNGVAGWLVRSICKKKRQRSEGRRGN
ncbi:hypothetical protein BD410DRAFT_792533 [Rickenella mellea]|uniref:Uncharacterized protein n=1 Tax=Rickenella mellea TaxID=50990 RepID=A0A4Y7PVE9_9AGAM|nr:hypothetical protein BD410DRAFT_792533 [Rickenella mellea]